ncbi:MAG: hypothetical protein GX648_05300 [Crenarchaeota archaeon]|jgi:hypothetical protein|nr:hypothetical protein [Thermoproteota archaeon]
MATAIIIHTEAEILEATANEMELKLTFTITNPTMEHCKFTVTTEENFFEKMEAVGNDWIGYVKLTPYDYPIKNCIDIKATVTKDKQTIVEKELCLYQLKLVGANKNVEEFLAKVNEITKMIAKNGLTLTNRK